MPISNPYTSQNISGYNASPPPNDGSKTVANQLDWDKHKEKLSDPVKVLAEAINSAISSAFDDMVVTTEAAEQDMVLAMQVFS